MLNSQATRYHERYEMSLYSEYDRDFGLTDPLTKEDVKQLLIHKLSVKQQNEVQREQKRKSELARLCRSSKSGINLFRRDQESYETVEYLNRKIRNAEKELLRTKGKLLKKTSSNNQHLAESKYSKLDANAINKEVLRNKAVAVKNENNNPKLQFETKKSIAEVIGTYQKQHKIKLERKLEKCAEREQVQCLVKRSKDPTPERGVERSKNKERNSNFNWSEFNIEHEIEDILFERNADEKTTNESVAPRISDADVELKMALKYKDLPVDPPVQNGVDVLLLATQPKTTDVNAGNIVSAVQQMQRSVLSKPKRVAKKRAKSRVEKSSKIFEPLKKSRSMENEPPYTNPSIIDASKSNGVTVPKSEKPKFTTSSGAKEKIPENILKKSSSSKPAVKKELSKNQVTAAKEEAKLSQNEASKDEVNIKIQNDSSNRKQSYGNQVPDRRLQTKVNIKNFGTHAETSTPQSSSVAPKTKVQQGINNTGGIKTHQTPVNKQPTLKENKVGKGIISSSLSNQDKKVKDPVTKSTGIVDKIKNFVGTDSQPEVEEEGSDFEENNSVKYNIINSIRPVNTESEKARFFKAKFDYNPIFKYYNALPPGVLSKYSNASDLYLPQAVKIMKLLIRKYGSYEKFEANTGGRVLTRQEIIDLVKDYCQRENFPNGEIILNLSEDLLSTASMTRTQGPHGILCVRIGEIHESWIEGLLRHELSTHYIRGCNNLVQPWARSRERKKFKLLPVNPTEEGLASLHTVLLRQDPLLFRNALLYFSIAMAAKLSFRDLFLKLGEFVHDPNRRWDYCMRAKRGQTDTSKPGCFAKDQVYLTGALNILKNRKNIDFEALMKLGKVSFEDVDRLKKSSGGGDLKNDTLRMPSFMANMKFYRSRLDFIMKANGLSDQDFKQSSKQVSSVDECRYDI